MKSKIMTVGILFVVMALVVGLFAGISRGAVVMSPDNIPDGETGGRAVCTMYSATGGLDAQDIVISITKVDADTPYIVKWAYQIVVTANKTVATITVAIPDTADYGTYTISVITPNEGMGVVTLYVPDPTPFPWLAFLGLLITGITFLGIALYAAATKTKTDDWAIAATGIPGVAFLIIAAAVWFGILII